MSEANGTRSKQLLNRKQLAERWGCCTKTLERLEANGKLMAIRIGDGLIRYSEDAIEKVERTGRAAS